VTRRTSLSKAYSGFLTPCGGKDHKSALGGHRGAADVADAPQDATGTPGDEPGAPDLAVSLAPSRASPSVAELWDRIKHHKVAQWTLAYVALAYTLLHGVEMLASSLSWSHAWVRLFTLLLIFGVPVVITLAWYHGARGQQRASGTEIMIIALLLAIGGAVIWRDHPTHDVEVTPARSRPETNPQLPAVSHKSIAVLPFADMSENKDQDYFADGLSEELLNLLANVSELHVAARTSSFYYKGKDIQLPQIARELNVSHIVEGSVRKAGNQVRINAQLVRTSDGYRQWSQTYNRTLEDIFAVQEEIAASVVTQLKATLLDTAPRVRKTTPEAYALFLQGRQQEREYTQEGIGQSIALYQQVLSIDPNYAPAWNGLAANYFNEGFLGVGSRPAAESFRLARDAASKALAIDPASSLAHVNLAHIARAYDNDLATAARHMEQALALDPADVDTVLSAGAVCVGLGRLDTAARAYEYGAAHDPLSAAVHGNLGWVYELSGRLDDALIETRTALKLSPGMVSINQGLGELMMLKGDNDAALVAMQKESNEGWRLYGLAMANYALGQESASNTALAELIEKHEKSWSSTIARVYAFRGEFDRAFEWLEKAVAYHDTGVVHFPVEPFLRNLHQDPRWLPFLRRHGMAPEQLAKIKFDVNLPQ